MLPCWINPERDILEPKCKVKVINIPEFIVFSLFETWFFSVKRRVAEEITSSSSAQFGCGISLFVGSKLVRS